MSKRKQDSCFLRTTSAKIQGNEEASLAHESLIESISCRIQDALSQKFCDLSLEEIKKGYYVYVENVLNPLTTSDLMLWKSAIPKSGWTGIQKIQGNGDFRKGHYRYQTSPGTRSYAHYSGVELVDQALRNIFTCKDDVVRQYYLKSTDGRKLVYFIIFQLISPL